MVIFVDGRFVDAAEKHVSALDRGFALGDGVFETLRAYGGRIFRSEAHLRRLREGARRLAFELPWSNDELGKALAEVMQRNAPSGLSPSGRSLADAVLRLTVSRGVPPSRGLAPPSEPRPTLVVQAVPATPPSTEECARGWSAVVATVRRNEMSPLSNIKSCNYLDNVLAKVEAMQAGTDDAIMLNTVGDVACASAANVFLVVGGKLMTPWLASGVLPGVTRAAIVELASALGLGIEERAVAPRELASADEAFLTNSVIEVMPLTRFEGQAIGDGTPGPITRRLAEAYRALTYATEGGTECKA